MRKKLKPTKQDNKSTANSNGVSKRKYNDTFSGNSINIKTEKQENTTFGINDNKSSDLESRLSRIENSMSRMMHTLENFLQNFMTQAIRNNHSNSSMFNNNSLSPTPSEDFNKSAFDSEEQQTSHNYKI